MGAELIWRDSLSLNGWHLTGAAAVSRAKQKSHLEQEALPVRGC